MIEGKRNDADTVPHGDIPLEPPQPPPARVGPYRLDGELGRGGMGLVFLGRDDLLQRTVAIKVLPHAVALDPEWRSRFLHEARILASLNHPNIATVFGLEETSGSYSLVMEHVEGRTLDCVLRDEAPALPALIEILRQIAAALQAAHDRGVIHRDLKPGNIMITPEGSVKVVDFGMAGRISRGVAPAPEVTTANGPSLMGTIGYMSPEQITGATQDERTDVFALGCILFECLARRSPFRGGSPADTIARTLHAEPPWRALPPETPPALRGLLEDCLQKSPERRLADLRRARSVLEAALGEGRDVTAGRSMAPPWGVVRHLPVPLTSFVGRESELTVCGELLDRARLLTLTGLPGAGKSRLLQEAGIRAAARFAEVVYVDLAAVLEPLLLPAALLASLAGGDAPGHDARTEDTPSSDPAAELTELCRGRRLLLLIDNPGAGILEAVGSLLGALLAHGASAKAAVAAREPLGLPGEMVLRVPMMRMGGERGHASVRDLLACDAVRLFADRAAFARPGFRVTEENVRTVAGICRELDGIPLAIELAAARVKVLEIEEIASRLSDRFRLLGAAGPAGKARHTTLRAAMEWSYDQLGPREQTVLHALAVFPAGASLEDVVFATGSELDDYEVLDALTRLADKSLLLTERAPGAGSRYRLLQTVTRFAEERSRDHGGHERLRLRQLARCEALIEEARDGWIGPESASWLARVEGVHGNILAALDFCETTGPNGGDRAGRGLRLAADLFRFWQLGGHLQLGRDRLRRLLAASNPTDDLPTRARAMYGSGVLSEMMRDCEHAREMFERSLLLWNELDDRRNVARAHNGLGVLDQSLGRVDAAREHFEHSLRIHRELDNRRGISIGLNNLGDIALVTKDHATAQALFEESLELARLDGDSEGMQIALGNLARLACLSGAWPRAADLLLQSLRMANEMGTPILIGLCLESVAALASILGDAEEGARLLVAGGRMLLETGYARSSEESELRAAALQRIEASLDPALRQDLEAEARARSDAEAVAQAEQWLSLRLGAPPPDRSA